MTVIFLVLFILTSLLWIFVMITDRRTISVGFLLLLGAFFFGCFLISEALADPAFFSEHFVIHILLDIELLFLAALLIAYPMVLTPVFLIGGLILMKREGIKGRNLLSLFLATLLIVYDIICPLIIDVRTDSPPALIYRYMTIISLYFVIHLSSFWISDLINLTHIRKDRGLDYIVVLGAGLRGTKPTPLLASRIDKGIEVYRNNPGAKLIFSGGRGVDEEISEARAMADYAVSRGVDSKDMLLEDGSTTTEENIRFSKALMEKDTGGTPSFSCAIATSSYHLMRALLIARRQRLTCIGYGARTRLYFSLNAFLREYAAYFRDTRKKRIIHLAALTVICILIRISRSLI